MRVVAAALVCAACAIVALEAQGPPGGRGAQPPRTARAAAPVDLVGQWVSVISEDWRWRMVTPLKGDFANIPVTEQARTAARAWDPDKDEAAGEACRAYGAPAIMRVPGRVRISWQDDDTLKIETDAGRQTRLLRFRAGAAPTGSRDWQGYSTARWEPPANGVFPPPAFALGVSPRAGAQGRSLEVQTTQLRPGYLRKNGIPYSADATVTEYFDLFKESTAEWFVVTTIVRDPINLTGPWVTSSNFKRETDTSKWSPSPCSAK
ncbi:MAG TPA: hypothetical protein VH436_16345 [Vicinamibacterales bacterium]